MTITTYTYREIALKAERDTLRKQLAEAQALIEASRKQEAVAWMRKDGDMITALEKRPNYSYTHYYDRPLFAAPVVADDVLKDALKKIADAAFKHGLSLVKTADGFDLLRLGTATAGMGGAA